MLRSWVVSLMEEGLNPSSINRKIASLRAYYGFLRRKKHISNDPTKILSALKTRKKLPAFVEEKAMEMLFEADTFADDFAGIRDRVILELLYGSGIRLAELIGLEEKDLDLAGRTIRVFGKRAKERIVPLSTTLIVLLKKYLEQRAPIEGVDALI
jgi:integrase/recombinase XerC